MKWYQWLFCILVIALGIYCSIDGYKIITAKSSTHGNYKYVSNQTDEFFVADCIDCTFNGVQDGKYSWTKTYEHEDFNGVINDYILLVNGVPTYNQITSAGSIKSSCILDFLNTDGNFAGVLSFDIIINFYTTGTEVKIIMQKTDASLDNFLNYKIANGLEIRVDRLV